MRRLFSIFAFALLATTAVSPAYADDFSGAYVADTIGGALSSSKDFDTSPTNPNCWWCASNFGGKSASVVTGAQMGYNFRYQMFLVGLEGEYNFGKLNSGASDPIYKFPTYRTTTGAMGDIVMRLGVVYDKTLFYAKIGYGLADQQVSWTDTSYSAYANGTRNLSGAVFGGGVEYALNSTWSLKAEYERFQFGGTTVMNVQNYPGTYQQVIKNQPIDLFKVGIAFHFGAN
jgi:outer membrane immunogenic protein